tara:strand:+ start:2703 stop:3305 length:603 start_codon:yes stop_codon:yes gene_type:complete
MANSTKKDEAKDELDEEKVSELETEELQEEDNAPIQKVKAKRPKTQKQIDAFNALQERNKVRWAEKRKAKEDSVNLKVAEVADKEKPKPKPICKTACKKQVVEESDEEEIEYVKAKPRRRKKKKIVIEQDDSSSDDEIVISRSRRKDKSIKRKEQEEGYKQEMINQQIEKEKPLKEVEEKVEEKVEKPISHRDLLRAFGL